MAFSTSGILFAILMLDNEQAIELHNPEDTFEVMVGVAQGELGALAGTVLVETEEKF